MPSFSPHFSVFQLCDVKLFMSCKCYTCHKIWRANDIAQFDVARHDLIILTQINIVFFFKSSLSFCMWYAPVWYKIVHAMKMLYILQGLKSRQHDTVWHCKTRFDHFSAKSIKQNAVEGIVFLWTHQFDCLVNYSSYLARKTTV